MPTVLVVGATGETGRPLVEQLLAKNHAVRVIVRSPEKFSAETLEHPNLTVLEASLLDLSDAELQDQVEDCDAVVSCLGHVISLKGMYGSPRKLCTDAARRLCQAIEENGLSTSTKFVLMNTVAVGNPALSEKRSLVERALLTVLKVMLPPQRDNVAAATHLRRNISTQSKHVEWCIVRPDSLINAEVSPYEIVESPVTGVFSGRPTTRSNVAHFMSELIEDAELWDEWKFRAPVIMNSDS